MAIGSVTASNISFKFPKYITTSVVIGDSQCKYMHNHFDPGRKGTPAFIAQSGAGIQDAHSLLDFVPKTTTSIVLHVGTNDVSKISAEEAFERYRTLLDKIARDCPNIKTVYATLVLPRSINRRRGRVNHRFVQRCNREACQLNDLLRRYCRKTKGLFFLDHGFEWLPPCRVLAADGLHPSFEGVALMASHLHQTLRRTYGRTDTTWRDHFSAPTSDAPAPAPTSATSAAPKAPTTASASTRNERVGSTFAAIVRTTPRN